MPPRRHAAARHTHQDAAPDVVVPRGPRPGDHRGNPATSDRIYDDDEAEFLAAIEAFRRRTGTKFPTWSDALAVARSLGYRKVTEATPC
jgi:hypothetical protein